MKINWIYNKIWGYCNSTLRVRLPQTPQDFRLHRSMKKVGFDADCLRFQFMNALFPSDFYSRYYPHIAQPAYDIRNKKLQRWLDWYKLSPYFALDFNESKKREWVRISASINRQTRLSSFIWLAPLKSNNAPFVEYEKPYTKWCELGKELNFETLCALVHLFSSTKENYKLGIQIYKGL